MDIAKLNRRVSFENPTTTTDAGMGQDVSEWVEWLETWASVERKSGFRNFSEGFESTVTRYSVKVRYRQLIESTLTKQTRIVYENKRFSIDSVELEDEKKRIYHFNVTATN